MYHINLMSRLYRLGKPPGPTLHIRLYNLAFTSFTRVYYINDLHQRCTRWSEYSLKLPYLQHSLLARRVFFMSSIHAFVAPYCITTSAALGSGSLIFKHQHCYLFSKHQHCYLIFKYQHCHLFFKHHHCSRSSSVFTAFRSSSVFSAFRSSSVTTASTVLYWPLTWHFPLNLYVLRSFHRLTSCTGESHHRS